MSSDMIREVDRMSVDDPDIAIARIVLEDIGMGEVDAARAILKGMHKDIEKSNNMFYDTALGEYGSYKNQADLLFDLGVFIDQYGITKDLNIIVNGLHRDVIINDLIIKERNPVNTPFKHGIVVGGVLTELNDIMVDLEVEDIICNRKPDEEIYVIVNRYICDVELILG